MPHFKLYSLILALTSNLVYCAKYLQYNVNHCPGDNHWPLNNIGSEGTLNDLKFLNHGSVIGNGVDDRYGVLSLNGTGYVQLNGFQNDCLTDPARCINGFTLSFWMKYGGIISQIVGLNTKYHAALDAWLAPVAPKKSRWLPCYQASKDGWKGSVFHRNCDGKATTLTIIKVRGFVFGGFLSKPWGPNVSGYIADQKAFLFSLSSLSGAEPFKLLLNPQQFSKAAHSSSTTLPAFGVKDLVLADDANTNVKSRTYPGGVYKIPVAQSDEIPHRLLAGSQYFPVDEIEVFYNQALVQDQSYILTSGAENRLTTGFTIFNKQASINGMNSLEVKVITSRKIWTGSLDTPDKRWKHVAVRWNSTGGLKIYVNGQCSNATTTENSAWNVLATKRMTYLAIGHSNSTSLHSGQNLQMYALTTWRAAITDEDLRMYMNTVCSPLQNENGDDFIWKYRTSPQTSQPTGSRIALAPRRLPKDFYLRFDSNSFANFEVPISTLDSFTFCYFSAAHFVKAVFSFVVRDQSNKVIVTFSSYRNAEDKMIFTVQSSRWESTQRGTWWHHACVTYKSVANVCKVSVYISGSLKKTFTDFKCDSISKTANFYINEKLSSFNQFNGYLRDFNLWDRVLSSSEVKHISSWCSLVMGNIIAWASLYSKFVNAPSKTLGSPQCNTVFQYIDSSYPRKKGQIARLVTSEYIPVRINCLYFEYSMYGKNIGRLSVYLRDKYNSMSLIWSLAGDQGNTPWKSVYVPLHITTKSKIVFEGIIGDRYLGDTAIGFVSLKISDSCQGGTGKEYVKIQRINSKIINNIEGYKNELQGMLINANLQHFWGPCYTLSEHGWLGAEELLNRCGNRGPTVTLIRHLDDVFGGVFDYSWWEYGRYTSQTVLPSNKSFLFSLKSNAGNYVQFSIKAPSYSLNCTQYQQYFPNFEDLKVDHVSRIVTGTFGHWYGGSASGNFVKDQPTFVPSDIEVLVPKVTFCPEKCPQDMQCDVIKGKCICDVLSRFYEFCQKGVFIDNFTSDAYDAFPMNHPSRLDNLQRPKWGVIKNSSASTGPHGVAVLTGLNDYIAVKNTHSCLRNPSDCPTGITVSVWLKLVTQIESTPVFFFCSDSCPENSTGFRIERRYGTKQPVILTVTTLNERCSYEFNSSEGLWEHLVFTWSTQHKLVLYQDGKVVNAPKICDSKSYFLNPKKLVVLGKGGAVAVDDYFVWAKLVPPHIIEQLYNLYTGRKNMALTFQYTSTTTSFQILYSYTSYRTSCQDATNSVMTLISSANYTQPSVKDCKIGLIYTSDRKAFKFLLVFMYTNTSGYNEVEPLIKTLTTLQRLGSRNISEITLGVDNVYSKPCHMITSVLDNSVTLKWTCPSPPAYSFLLGYTIEVVENATSDRKIHKRPAERTSTVLVLKPRTLYKFTITPLTLEGIGNLVSEPKTALTRDAAITAAPWNVTGVALSLPNIEIKWEFNVLDWPQLKGFRIVYNRINTTQLVNTTALPNATEITISGLVHATAYQFVVQGFTSDTSGPSSQPVQISTSFYPLTQSPTIITATPVNQTVVMVTWQEISASAGFGPILGYTVNYTDAANETLSINSSGGSTIISGLSTYSSYRIAVQGFTARGVGPVSPLVDVRTAEGVPSASPNNVKPTPINATSFSITWNAVTSPNIHGVLRGYGVKTVVATGEVGEINVILICSTSIILEDLYPYTDYIVNISAFTIRGFGPEIQTYISNKETAPKIPPAAIRTITIGKTTVNITWDPVPVGSADSPINSYVVWYSQSSQPSVYPNSTLTTNESSTMHAVLTGLHEYTQYDVRVAAINSVGYGVYSLQWIIRTAEGLPTGSVRNATVSAVKRNSTLIQWNPPPASQVHGKLRGYMITIYDALRQVNTSRSVCSNKTSFNLTNLFPYTQYSVYFRAFSSAGLGSAKLAAAFVTLEAAPDAPPQNVTSQNTSSSEIRLTWMPPPATNINGILKGYIVIWYETLAQDPVVFNKTIHIQRRKRRSVTGSTSQTIVLDGLKKFTMYTIRVLGFTIENGVFLETNTTTAEDVPSLPPPNVTASISSSTNISVAWKAIPKAFQHGILLGYHVFYQQADQSGSTPLVETVDQPLLSTELNNLNMFTTYLVSVAGFTTPGTGNVSETVRVSTDQDVPDAGPPSLVLNGASTTHLSLTWKPVSKDKQNGVILGYTLSLHHTNGSLVQVITINGSSILSCNIRGLISWTNYTAKILAFTIKGSGPWTPDVLVATKEEVPLPPDDHTATPLSSTSIRVTWEPSNTTFLRGILRGYHVMYTSRGSVFPPIARNITTAAGTTSTVLTDLHKFTEYEISVSAFTIADGNTSLAVVVKTFSDAPSAGPSGLGLLTATPYSLTIHLGKVPPEHRNGIITRYKVNVTKVGSNNPTVEKLYSPSETLAHINGLTPFTLYMIDVSASTDTNGWGMPSHITLRTAEGVPGGTPQILNDAERLSVDTIPVAWGPVSSAEANGVVTGYRVKYQLISLGEEPIDDSPVIELDVMGTAVNLTGLEQYGRYNITVSAFTVNGFGPEVIFYGETCRCQEKLFANWRSYSPYVEVSKSTGEPEGIIPNLIKEMTQECCLTCQTHRQTRVEFFTSKDGLSAFKENEADLKTNISEAVDFSFPLYGTKEQKKYPGGFSYRALIESPGVVLVVNIDTETEENPYKIVIASLLGCIYYLLMTVISAFFAGFIIWILDRNTNPEFFPMSFIKGTYEGLWWAFITMTTLGYGDRYPKSFASKCFAIVWMLYGIVIFGVLTSNLQTAVTTVTITVDQNLYDKQIAAIHNSPEYYLGLRLNAQVNKAIQPKTFEEVYDALIQGRVYGALLDAYAIGNYKKLFEHPSLQFAKMYDFKSAYGIVLGGTSGRLRRCFYTYMQSKRDEIFERIAKHVKLIERPTDEQPRTIEYSTGLFSVDNKSFTQTLKALLVALGILTLLGSLYSVVRHSTCKVASVENEDQVQWFCEDIQKFKDNMSRIAENLRSKHTQQIRDLKRSKSTGKLPDYGQTSV